MKIYIRNVKIVFHIFISYYYPQTTIIIMKQEEQLQEKEQPEDLQFSCLAISPDGNKIAAGCKTGLIRFYDAQSGEPSGSPFHAHDDQIYCLAFSQDGRVLASASYSSLEFWNPENGNRMRENKKTNQSQILCICFAPDGKILASGQQSQIYLWNQESDPTKTEVMQKLNGHSGRIADIQYSPNGNHMISCTYEAEIIIWDAETYIVLKILQECHSDSIRGLTFHPNGKKFISSSDDKTLKLWDLQTGKQIGIQFNGHNKRIKTVCFSKKGDKIISGSDDKTIRVWDEDFADKVQRIETESQIKSIAFSPNSEMIAAGRQNNQIILWDVKQRKMIGTPFKCHDKTVTTVCFSMDSELLASGSEDKQVKIINIQFLKALKIFKGHEDGVQNACFYNNDKQIISAGKDGKILLWDIQNQNVIGEIQGSQNEILISSDGRKIAQSRPYTDTINIIDIEIFKMVKSLKKHRATDYASCFSPDGKYVVSGCDNCINIWNIETGAQFGEDFYCQGAIVSMAYSPNGDTILTSSKEPSMIVFWNAKTQKLIRKLQGVEEISQNLQFNLDGSQIIVRTQCQIQIWDFQTGEKIGFYKSRHEITRVCFTRNMDTVAFANRNKEIVVWPTEIISMFSLKNCAKSIDFIRYCNEDTQLIYYCNPNIIIYDLEKRDDIKQINCDIGYFKNSQFSKNGKFLIYTNYEDIIYLIDLELNIEEQKPEAFIGHSNKITVLQFFNDSTQFFSLSKDNTIRIWDIKSKQQVKIFETKEQIITARISIGNQQIAIALQNSVVIWNLENNLQELVKFNRESDFQLMTFSYDLSLLAAVDDNNFIQIFNTMTGQLQLIRYYKGVRLIEFLPKNNQLMIHFRDEEVQFIDPALMREIGGPIHFDLSFFCFSQAGDKIIVGNSQQICEWELSKIAETKLLEDIRGEPLLFNNESDSLIVQTSKSEMILFDLNSHIGIGRITNFLIDSVKTICISDDNQMIALTGNYEYITLRDSKGNFLQKLVSNEYITCIKFTTDCKKIISAGEKQITIWDIESGKIIGERIRGIDYFCNDSETYLTISPDGQTFVSWNNYSEIIFWEIESLKQIGEPISKAKGNNYKLLSIAFNKDGQFLVSSGNDPSIILWNTNTREKVQKIELYSEIYSIAFIDNDQNLLAAEKDYIHIIRLVNGAKIKTFSIGSASQIIAVIPQSQMLISIENQQNIIQFWDIQTGKQIGNPLYGHNTKITSIALSNDRQLLISGDQNKKLIIWNLYQWDKSQRFTSYSGIYRNIQSCSCSPDGQHLAAVTDQTFVKFWKIKTGLKCGEILENNIQIEQISYSPDGAKILIDGNCVKVYDIEYLDQINELEGHNTYITNISLSNDCQKCVSQSRDKIIFLWDLKTYNALGSNYTSFESECYGLQFSDSGNFISAYCENTIRVWTDDYFKEVKEIKGLSGHIKDAVYSHDGAFIATANEGQNTEIFIWNSTTFELCNKLEAHLKQVMCLDFSQDDKLLASGSQDHTIIIWDLSNSTKYKNPLVGHKSYIMSVKFWKDGTLLLSSSMDQTMRIWKIQTGETILKTDHPDMLDCAHFSPDYRFIASACRDYNIRLWELTEDFKVTLKQTFQTQSHVNKVRFSKNGDKLIKVTGDKTFKLFDLTEGIASEIQFIGHENYVNDACFSTSENHIFSVDSQGYAIMWETSTGKQLWNALKVNMGSVGAVNFSPTKQQLLICGQYGCVKLLNMDIFAKQKTISVKSKIIQMKFQKGIDQILSVSENKTINIWDAATGAQLKEIIPKDITVEIYDQAFLSILNDKVAFIKSNNITLWDILKEKNYGDTITLQDKNINFIAFNQNGTKILCASDDKTIILVDIEINGEVKTFSGHSTEINRVCFSNDGQMLASASFDHIFVWNNLIGQQLYAFENSSKLNCLHFSYDSKNIIVGDHYGVKIWDFATNNFTILIEEYMAKAIDTNSDNSIIAFGNRNNIILWSSKEKSQKILEGHQEVNSLVLSKDGKILVSGSLDSTIIVWNTETGEKVGDPLMLHSSAVNCVCISPDGKYIASGSEDQTINITELNITEKVKILKGHDDSIFRVICTLDDQILSGSEDGTIRMWKGYEQGLK